MHIHNYKTKKVYEITKVFQVNLESIGVEIMVNFTVLFIDKFKE